MQCVEEVVLLHTVSSSPTVLKQKMIGLSILGWSRNLVVQLEEVCGRGFVFFLDSKAKQTAVVLIFILTKVRNYANLKDLIKISDQKQFKYVPVVPKMLLCCYALRKKKADVLCL